MSTLHKHKPLSPAEYLEAEKWSEVKHEYVAGRTYAMVGTSGAPNLIAGNLYTALRPHLRGRPCRAFFADLKVRIEPAQVFYYPDVVVSCDIRDLAPSARVLSRPTLIVEVLSPTTERTDQEEKWHNYQKLESLQEYVLVAQNASEVRIYRRTGPEWNIQTFSEGEHVRLAAVDLVLPMAAIYEEVDFQATET